MVVWSSMTKQTAVVVKKEGVVFSPFFLRCTGLMFHSWYGGRALSALGGLAKGFGGGLGKRQEDTSMMTASLEKECSSFNISKYNSLVPVADRDWLLFLRQEKYPAGGIDTIL